MPLHELLLTLLTNYRSNIFFFIKNVNYGPRVISRRLSGAMLSSSVYLPFPVERRISLWAELCRFVLFPSHSVWHESSSLPLSCHPMAWAAVLLQGCSCIKCSGTSNTLTLGPQGQFFLTNGSGLPLSQKVKQDCQETVGIVAVRNQGNFCSLSPPRYFHWRSLGSFLVFMEAITQWDVYLGVGFLRQSLAV